LTGALRRLGVAIGLVGVLALVINNYLRVSAYGQTESTGYLVYYLQERGLSRGVAWFGGVTLVVWVLLVLSGGREVKDRIQRKRANVPEGIAQPTDDTPPLPEWLEEKASDAPTMIRVLIDALDGRLRRDYPRVLADGKWGEFRKFGTIGGCVGLALRLHVEVPQSYRTPLERVIRSSLEGAFPSSEAQYDDCVRSVRDALLEVSRSKRLDATFVLIAMWVLSSTGSGDSLMKDPELVAEVAQVYQNDFDGYWASLDAGA
jgi:hypothetical protein